VASAGKAARPSFDRALDRGQRHRVSARVEAWRPQGEALSDDRRYSRSSWGLDATQRAARVRGHGARETARPWGRAIALRADAGRMRKGQAPETCAMLRQDALNLRTPAKPSRHGVQLKGNRAGWDNDYGLTVLGICMRLPWRSGQPSACTAARLIMP
jgi:hypothetical protein